MDITSSMCTINLGTDIDILSQYERINKKITRIKKKKGILYKYISRKDKPSNNSDIGQYNLTKVLQFLHLPLYIRYPTTGISCTQDSGFLHSSQNEFLVIIFGYLYPLSILYSVALIKLASDAPIKNIQIYIINIMHYNIEKTPPERGFQLQNYVIIMHLLLLQYLEMSMLLDPNLKLQYQHQVLVQLYILQSLVRLSFL